MRLVNYCLLLLAFSQYSAALTQSDLYPPDWESLKSLTANKLAELPIESDMLAKAYSEVIVTRFERRDVPPEWWVAAQADLINRGNKATPLLLKLFEIHPLQQFREDLLTNVENFPGIDIAPFLSVARAYWREHQLQTPPRTCYAIARLLSRHGAMEDKSILADMKKHPTKEVGFVIEPDIERMTKRLNGTLKPTEWHDKFGRPPKGYDWPQPNMTKIPEAKPALSPPSEEPASSTPWSIVVVLIVAALGLLWLVLKRRS